MKNSISTHQTALTKFPTPKNKVKAAANEVDEVTINTSADEVANTNERSRSW